MFIFISVLTITVSFSSLSRRLSISFSLAVLGGPFIIGNEPVRLGDGSGEFDGEFFKIDLPGLRLPELPALPLLPPLPEDSFPLPLASLEIELTEPPEAMRP